MLEGQHRLYQRRSGDALGDQRPASLYALDDHLGSAAAHTAANGQLVSREEYYPFGETSFGSTAKQRHRYCGKELDQESGLYYYGARCYAPWVCRFFSSDPKAKDFNFISAYCYADNNPLNNLDANGEGPVPAPAPNAKQHAATRQAIRNYTGSFVRDLLHVPGVGRDILRAVESAGSNFGVDPYWRLGRNISPNSYVGALGITGEGVAGYYEGGYFNSQLAAGGLSPYDGSSARVTYHEKSQDTGTWDFKVDYNNRGGEKILLGFFNLANGSPFTTDIPISSRSTTTFLYEVKSDSPNAKPGKPTADMANRVARGFGQAIKNAELNKNAVSILYLDEAAYLKAYATDPTRFSALFSQLTAVGGFLKLNSTHFQETKQAVDQINKDILDNPDTAPTPAKGAGNI